MILVLVVEALEEVVVVGILRHGELKSFRIVVIVPTKFGYKLMLTLLLGVQVDRKYGQTYLYHHMYHIRGWV